MQATKDFLVEIGPTATQLGFSFGGIMLGLGGVAKAVSPPTLDQFSNALHAVCGPLNSGDPNKLLCQKTDLTSVEALFEDNGSYVIGAGATLMAIPVGIRLVLALHHQCNYQNSARSQAVSGYAANFFNNCVPAALMSCYRVAKEPVADLINNFAPTAEQILMTFGGVLLGGGLSSAVEKPSPSSQFKQVTNALCTPYPPNNDADILCDMTKLNSTAASFYQHGSTALGIGGGTIGLIGLAGLAYAVHKCYQKCQARGDGANAEINPLVV